MVMTVMILIIGIMGGYKFMFVCYKFLGSFFLFISDYEFLVFKGC